jgi:hypothetical protein
MINNTCHNLQLRIGLLHPPPSPHNLVFSSITSTTPIILPLRNIQFTPNP